MCSAGQAHQADHTRTGVIDTQLLPTQLGARMQVSSWEQTSPNLSPFLENRSPFQQESNQQSSFSVVQQLLALRQGSYIFRIPGFGGWRELNGFGEEFLNPGCQCCKKEAVSFVQPFIWVGFPVQPLYSFWFCYLLWMAADLVSWFGVPPHPPSLCVIITQAVQSECSIPMQILFCNVSSDVF